MYVCVCALKCIFRACVCMCACVFVRVCKLRAVEPVLKPLGCMPLKECALSFLCFVTAK